jgi:hypothetical protein
MYLKSDKMVLSHDSDSWFYSIDDKKVGVGRDWRWGIMDRQPSGTFPSHGQYFEIEQALLADFLQAEDARVAHVLRVEVMTSKDSYSEPKVHRHCEFVGLSPIIT